jgi:phosphoribosylglycinamide formyltransferase 2
MKRDIQTIMLLGAGELGREVVISAKRLGKRVVAVDRYAGAPAMQVADAFEIINMLDADQLAAVVAKHRPDVIVPEIEAIRTEKLREFERAGVVVIPTAEAAFLTMNRVAIREVAARELGLRTAKYAYATSLDELISAAVHTGVPCVVKPVMSSSGKGQSTVETADGLGRAWDYACSNMRGDEKKVIVEEFIEFHLEITLLTVRQWDGPTLYVDPVGHRQERGDYQESWIPAALSAAQLAQAQRMAKTVTDRLGGAGIFGVEFFITKDEVIFSELSPRPHDTGMVTMISQDLSEFDLHVRAILGLPIPVINYHGPSASAVILADRESPGVLGYDGIDRALALRDTQVRIFGKPDTRKYRRMGVALARAANTDDARKLAKQAADCVTIRYE